MRTVKLRLNLDAYKRGVYYNRGKHCFVVNDPDFEGCILKIFDAYPQKELTDASLAEMMWGDPPRDGNPNMSVSLVDATRFQNFCWLHGIAPRVFEIVKVQIGKALFWAQCIEKVVGPYEKDTTGFYRVCRQVQALAEIYGFENDKDDVGDRDVINGLLLDFNTFHPSPGFEDRIKEIYARYGRYGKIYYQDVPSLGMKGGPRKTEQRVKEMKLSKIAIKNKSVADFGCAGGAFCRYSKDRTADHVVGVDFPDVPGSSPAYSAAVMSIYLGYYDIDYYSFDLRNRPDIEPADVTFFLSMNYHIGIPSWLSDLTREVCVFEDNSRNRDAKPILSGMFSRVEYVGNTFDHDKTLGKPVYHCYK